MTSSNVNSLVPKYLLIELKGIQEIVDSCGLVPADRDELITQVFDYYLNENAFVCADSYRPKLEMLRIDLYRLTTGERERLVGVAMAIHALVREQLVRLNIPQVVYAQSGFFYSFDHFRSKGECVLLRNLT